MLNTKLTILKHPHQILSSKSEDVDITGPNRKDYVQFIGQMMKMADNPKWGRMIGLAAPQVGRNWNIFLADVSNKEHPLGHEMQVFVNPTLEIDPLAGHSDLQEGCYSLDENRFDYPTRRAYKVILRWIDINGEPQKRKFVARDAQIIQHEFDHLLGKLCVDHNSTTNMIG